jgi:hypothetical protein
MSRPNLFDFATSELSQDAFLCWLAALADHSDAELQRLGQNFIAWLWTSATNVEVKPSSVRLQREPRPQWKKIDVTLDVVVAGEKARIIIEDKTDTTQHSDQLQRYLKLASEDGSRVVPIYFKTGYHFGSDTKAAAAGYAVIGLREWVSFLHEQAQRNDILDDYRMHMTEVLRRRDDALAAIKTPLGFEQLKEPFVQYEFIGALAGRCDQTIGGSAVHRGTNMGGSPWTHYRFARYPAALPGRIDEVLFHRVDKRQNDQGQKGCYYLSTRQYAPVKAKPESAKAKLQRLGDYRAAFNAAVKETATGLAFAVPAADHRGANESEVGILFFDDSNNTTSRVLELFPAVHRAFLAKIANGPTG